MASQTRCDAFGHSYSFWKEGGRCYMKCDYCGDVQPMGHTPNVLSFNSKIEQNRREWDAELYRRILARVDHLNF